MKKILVLIILAMVLCAALYASENGFTAEEIKRFQLQNAFIGYGVGSRNQGDLETAKKLMAIDITGTAVTVAGGVGLLGSIVVYGGLKALVGDITKADIYISAGMIGAGLVTMIIARIMGSQAPPRY
ncbi:MAG: hypothetical protein IKP61_08810 [Spirochaetales bacterium]|nr:hypothetical protein [Spirochaetales bacterium]